MASSVEYYIKIYTNDGSTLLKEFYTYLYLNDPILCLVSDTGMSVDIPETDEHEASVEYYTYSGSKKFLGFATTANSSVITYKIGDGFNAMEEMKPYHVLSLYIVEENPKTTKTFDLSTLNLSAGTHEITVKAMASGYADSVASNAVSYVVAGDTVQVSGTWYLNETFASIPPDQNITFVSNGQTFNNINTPDKNNIQYDTTIAYSIGAWVNETYRTITFDGKQTVSKEFYDWLTANAVRQTISFTIENAHDYDTTTYYADVGMTWAEWCDSEYNTRGGYIFNNTVMVWCYPTTEEYNSGLKDVVPTDVISNGGAYVATTDGPCVT